MANIPNYLDRFSGPYLTNTEAQAVYSHMHNLERWFGGTAGAAPAVALPAALSVPYVLTANVAADTLGTEVAMIDGTETLGKAFQDYYDLHKILVVTTSGVGTFLLRMAFNANGEANFAAAVANGHYMDVPFVIGSASDRAAPTELKCGQIEIGPTTGKVWGALASSVGGRTASIFIGLHLYPARPGGLG